jgi:hypothetical protein
VQSDQHAELIPLYLPSAFSSDKRTTFCISEIDKIEDHLRFAQALDALVQLRLQLMKRTTTAWYKSQNVNSQHSYICFHALQDQTEHKIKAAQVKYDVARKAILSLRGPGSWEKTLQVLHPYDVQGLGEHALRDDEQETERQMQKLAGWEGNVNWNLDEVCSLVKEPLSQIQFIPNLARGEGRRVLSWIWYSTTGEELEKTEIQARMFSNLLIICT